MRKFFKKENAILCCILIGFITVFVGTVLLFMSMDRKIDVENRGALQEVGNLYISSVAQQTVSHSQTYFENRFELMEQALNTMLAMNEKEAAEYLKTGVSNDFDYVALIAEDGTIETFRGDTTFAAYDVTAMEDALTHGENKVILINNRHNDKAVAMVYVRDFSFGGRNYEGLMCGFPTETLNTVFNLSYGDANLTYSFIVRKKDSAFVVRNEGAFRRTYFERIYELYESYGNMKPENYVENFKAAMDRGESYRDTFVMGGNQRMFYATPLPYSDWYLITFIQYEEMEAILGNYNDRRDSVMLKYIAILGGIFMVVFGCYAVLSYKQIIKMRKKEREAVSANKAKSDFLSNMSHDIRTPMNVIVGMTEIARSYLEDKEKMERCLDKISMSSRHLLSLINDVLDMSKIESGKMSLSMMQMSLQESMESIVTILQPQLKSKQQKFDIYIQDIISEDVHCDSLRLNQILINLLSNAVKYTPENGSITLTLTQEKSPRGEDYVRNHFRVKDNGMGMTEEFRKVVFDSFTREDRKRIKKEEGTGLGLTITKHLVEAMGGTIEVKSTLYKGSEFHVVLDLKKGDIDKGNMRLENLRVLVVDDNEDQCKNTKEMLAEIGAYAEYAVSGSQAIERVREQSADDFDIILIDWQMPDMNGLETAKKIREYTQREIPLILISAYDCADFEEESRNAGIDGFISKPLFKSTLFWGIKQYIEKDSQTEKPKASEINFSGEHILLAEDNELNREIAMELIGSAGLLVDCVENGKLCVDKFAASEEGYYKLILMDIRMPVMDGYEAAVAIRELKRSDADIPIIAMTADAFAEDVAKAKACGMNGHIAKPLDIAKLFATLKNELGM